MTHAYRYRSESQPWFGLNRTIPQSQIEPYMSALLDRRAELRRHGYSERYFRVVVPLHFHEDFDGAQIFGLPVERADVSEPTLTKGGVDRSQRRELHAYLAADKADYPRTWKGDGYARAEAAEAKVAELEAEIEQWRAFNMREGEMEDRALAAEAAADEMRADLTEARVGWGTAERALSDERAKVAPLTDESVLYDWVAAAFAGNGTVHFDSDAMDEDELWVRHVARSLARRTRAVLAGDA